MLQIRCSSQKSLSSLFGVAIGRLCYLIFMALLKMQTEYLLKLHWLFVGKHLKRQTRRQLETAKIRMLQQDQNRPTFQKTNVSCQNLPSKFVSESAMISNKTMQNNGSMNSHYSGIDQRKRV